MRSTLLRAARSPRLDLSVAVTGMHLLDKYGHTVVEIEQAGLAICARVPSLEEETSGAAMARAIGISLTGLVAAFEARRPDVVLVLGDRGEMLSAALAAIHLNIPVAHIHGGERSGTVDEPVRHAISKLSHFHFVATDGARDRLLRMGENDAHVFVTGAPGLDGLDASAAEGREMLCAGLRLDPFRPVALVVYHPVVQESAQAGEQMEAVLSGTLGAGAQAIVLAPNADAGGDQILTVAQRYAEAGAVRLLRHLPRERFVAWMARADAMVGNSSSGIIEAASLGLPVVNVGGRQRLRERSDNVVDAPPSQREVRAAVEAVLRRGRAQWRNVYGDGRAGVRIVELLETVPLVPEVLQKINAY